MNKKKSKIPKLFCPDFSSVRPLLLGKEAPRADTLLLMSIIILALCGTLTVFSAGTAYASFRYGDGAFFVKKQSVWLIAGLAVMILVARIRPRAVYEFTPLMYFGTVILLVLVLVIGFAGNGAKRWISIGPVTIQPSEIAKITMILMLARYFSIYGARSGERKNQKTLFLYGTLIPALIIFVPIILVMLQKHLSCIIILGTIGLLVILFGGVSAKYIAMFTGAGALGVTALALFTDYTKERITVWRNPEAYRLTGGWQTLQGLMAIGSGGLFGVGIGNSVMKHCYVSEPANDMIFAILCEETGFFGAVAVLSLFALLVTRGYTVALRAEDIFSRITAFGISTKMAVQVLLNVAVVTNTIPNTGISLPFFSYGGSSLLMLMFEMGLLLSISRFAKIKK